MKQSIIIIFIVGYLLATATSFQVRRFESADSSGTSASPSPSSSSSSSSTPSSGSSPSASSGSSPSASSGSSPSVSSGSSPSTTSGTTTNSSSSSSTNAVNLTDPIIRLFLAKTAVDRINILDQDSDFIFDFKTPLITIPPAGKGGNIVLANRVTFPAIIGNGISMAVANLGPCGLNTPHTHPRATELNYVVNGTLLTGFIAESGARQVNNTVPAGSASIFPKGSIHWLANLGCDTVQFVAALGDEDPGISEIAPNLFGIEKDVLNATLGGVSDDVLSNIISGIPVDIALGVQSCLQKCGLVQPSNSSSSSGSYSGQSTGSHSGSHSDESSKHENGEGGH